MWFNFKSVKFQLFKGGEKATSDSLVAYFDILGYKEIIQRSYISEKELIERIEYIAEDVYRTVALFTNGEKEIWNAYSFSDNFAIIAKPPGEGFLFVLGRLLWILSIIQYQLFALYGILIRGAVTRGEIYAGDKVIYGKGLIRAYGIENTVSIYPRIVVDTDLINDCIKFAKDLILEPVTFKGRIYDPNKINESNIFYMFPRLVFGKIYKSGEISKRKIDKWIELQNDDDNMEIVKKDFDGKLYIDFFQYLFFLEKYPTACDNVFLPKSIKEENIVDLYIEGFTLNIFRYIKNFGDNIKLLKKYLWICIKANRAFSLLGYHNLFSRSTILNLCDVNLSIIESEDKVFNEFLKRIPEE